MEEIKQSSSSYKVILFFKKKKKDLFQLEFYSPSVESVSMLQVITHNGAFFILKHEGLFQKAGLLKTQCVEAENESSGYIHKSLSQFTTI